MCRSFSPRFGDLVFRRCSRDEFEWRVRLSSAFRQEGMSSWVMPFGSIILDAISLVPKRHW